VRPNSTLKLPVKLGGSIPRGPRSSLRVDVGILNLTNYKPPAPDDTIWPARMTSEIRDLYGH